jgi:XapX domain-containing protein
VQDIKPYLISLVVGLVVGLLYSMLGVRSPAPPAVALIGLLGMLIGEQAGSATLTWLRTTSTLTTVQPPSDGKDHS